MKIQFALLAITHGSPTTFADTACTAKGGECLDWRYYVCTAGYEAGLCSGDSNRKCCNNCNAQCVNQENQNQQKDGACTDIGGKCLHNSNYCDGSFSSGKCGGDSSRQCCATGGSGGSGDCGLITYSNSKIKGYNGLQIRIDEGFKSDMDTINGYAISCSVTVEVTHAFRKEGQSIGGTVVPPASHSNHLVGHAIDFNLDTPRGWCNGDCLAAQSNSNAKCFTDKITGNRGLRWGQEFDDPVHIDDNLWYSNSGSWNDLYYSNQNTC